MVGAQDATQEACISHCGASHRGSFADDDLRWLTSRRSRSAAMTAGSEEQLAAEQRWDRM